ncbi:MAG TPA: D-alanine--D-alanine ligase [bacterium (Candidatus Stahlbacteria)]|nr:D-alanine--D-alanine ligase [Candidatus Stahlbacteria bacterium]
MDIIKEFRDKNIGVIMGGWSSEREISLISGRAIAKALRDAGLKITEIDFSREIISSITELNIDVGFIILHGRPGEDGTVQGLFELVGIPYTGSGIEASAIGMDKIMTKRLFRYYRISTPDYIYDPGLPIEKIAPGIESRLGFPVVIKPRFEGSSVGIVIVKNQEELIEQGRQLIENYQDIFFEEYIKGMNATVGILNDRALPILEIRPKTQPFYDYQAKYTAGETEYIVPAEITLKKSKKIQQTALKAHQVIGCSGFSRVDLIFGDDGRPYFLELNTLPGMTEGSNLPLEASAIGVDYQGVCISMLGTAKRWCR